MNIAMIGAGAMGSLFGGLLAEAGEEVTFLDIRRDHVDAVNANGLSIQEAGGLRKVRVAATTDPDTIAAADLCFVFVKSTHTGAVAPTAARLAASNGLVITLQNGMGNADILAEAVSPSRVIAGTTSHGATFVKPGVIYHAGEGETVIGPLTAAGEAEVKAVAARLNRAGIETRIAADVRSVLWAKLFINVGINAITALTGVRNGQLLDLEPTRRLCREAVEEAVAVARARGIAINENPLKNVFRVAAATATNRSSMGQDVDNGRLTEIDAINGFIVKMAEASGIPVPINRTLTTLVETLQAHYRDSR
jgi:2-dehydropantoate 2-reductase